MKTQVLKMMNGVTNLRCNDFYINFKSIIIIGVTNISVLYESLENRLDFLL
jgi:hypothetical protein